MPRLGFNAVLLPHLNVWITHTLEDGALSCHACTITLTCHPRCNADCNYASFEIHRSMSGIVYRIAKFLSRLSKTPTLVEELYGGVKNLQ